MSFQKFTIMGTLGKNAEVKTFKDKQYLAFSVAVSNGKDAQGNQRPSDWFSVLYSYNQQTQGWMQQRLTKGCVVYVEGRVSAKAYQNKEGQLLADLNVFATSVEPIGVPQRDNQGQGGYAPQQAPQPYGGGYAPQQYAPQQAPQQYAPQGAPQGAPQQYMPQQAPQGYVPQGAPQQAPQMFDAPQGVPQASGAEDPNLPF